MYVLKISKQEAEYLRDNGRGYDIHISSKSHKSRGKRYYATSSPKTMKLLDKFKQQEILETHDGR